MRLSRKKPPGLKHPVPYCLALLTLVAACQETADAPKQMPEPTDAVGSTCGNKAYLSAALYGSIEREIRWSAQDLHCESMLRPNGEGLRLRFTGSAAGSQLAIILALPALERGKIGTELPTVVTLTVEGSGRFFSTPTAQSCWSDIDVQEPVADEADHYAMNGTLFCVAPLGEINGEAAISIPEMAFSSVVDWSGE